MGKEGEAGPRTRPRGRGDAGDPTSVAGPPVPKTGPPRSKDPGVQTWIPLLDRQPIDR